MSYILIGSYPSPFVRRVRMLMENIPFEFKDINLYETEGNLELNRVNPINQIPVLMDGNKAIWDSRVIFNYLNEKFKFQTLSIDDENNLSAIDGALDAAVGLLLMKRSGININEEYMIVGRYKDRIESVLDYFKPYVSGKGLTEWNFLTMSIYTLLDWGTYREVLSLSRRSECLNFLEAHADRPSVVKTQIPKV